MNVLLVTNEYPPEKIAGTAMATQFLAEEVATRGVRVTVVVNTRDSAPSREVAGGIEVIRLRPLPIPATRMAQRGALLLRIARAREPDIIQGQSLSCGALTAAVGALLGIPSMTYVQGYDLYESSRWARRTYIWWALRRSDGVAAVTRDLRLRARAIVPRPIEVISHGLRMREAHGLDRGEARALLDIPTSVPVVLYVGRLLRIKGAQHLIRAMPRVCARRRDASLVIVGDGQQLPCLQALAHDLGIASQVMFAGARSHEEVIQFMRAADVFVLPSLAEPFGIVLLEAMSCGLPVVASSVMGIPSLVEDGVNGFLVPPGHEEALATAVISLLSDSKTRSTIGQRNVRKAQGYAMPAIAERFLDLWRAIRDQNLQRTGGRVV